LATTKTHKIGRDKRLKYDDVSGKGGFDMLEMIQKCLSTQLDSQKHALKSPPRNETKNYDEIDEQR